MTFPLLRLPLLASIEVIKNTDIKYLISLTQLSKTAKNLVKLSKVHIELTVLQTSIQFQKLAGQGMIERLEFSDLSEKPADIPFKPPRQSKFDDKIQYHIRTYKKMLDDFVEFFKICSVSFELETTFSYISCCFMEHAKGLGLKFGTARVAIAGPHGKICQSLLEVCSNASQFLVHFRTEEPFTFQGFNEYRMHEFRFVTMYQVNNWFTVEHMCALVNCSEVSARHLHWRDEDLNRFLKFWIACDGRLQSLRLWKWNKLVPIDSQVLMNGINNRALRFGDHIKSFEIQRNDGVKANVTCYLKQFSLEVIDV